MTKMQRFLVAITVLNVACAALSLSQVPRVNAATTADVTPVVRTKQLEIVDDRGRIRASIIVYPSAPAQEEGVVLRLVNGDGRPGVKMGSGEKQAGVAFINSEGNYLQVFGDGVKVTKDGKARANWP